MLLESRYLELSFDVERMRCCILTEPYRFLGIVFDGLLVNYMALLCMGPFLPYFGSNDHGCYDQFYASISELNLRVGFNSYLVLESYANF